MSGDADDASRRSNLDLLQGVANNSQNELVYAYDENGNQMAIGLIVNDFFAVPENQIDNLGTNECESEVDVQMNWIGGEEECTSSKEIFVKEEKICDDEQKVEDEPNQPRVALKRPVRVYKRKRESGNTLKKLKLRVKAMKETRKEITKRKKLRSKKKNAPEECCVQSEDTKKKH